MTSCANEVVPKLELLLEPVGIELTDTRSGSMGAWSARFENDEFVVVTSQDRSGDAVGIGIGSKVRRRSRAQMRGPTWLSALRGYLEGSPDHYSFSNIEEQLSWLADHLDKLLVTSFLNSDELNTWKVEAARRMFG
jgi:hypothetical protein